MAGDYVRGLVARLSVRDRPEFSAELKEAEHDVDAVSDATAKSGKASRQAARDVDSHRKSLSSFRTEAKKTATGLKELSVGTNGVFGRLFSAAGITAISLVASGIGSLGAASVVTVAAMAPMLGALSAIPATALAGASAFGVFKLATSNLGNALKVLGDRTSTALQKQQALAGLSPAAQGFVEQLNGLRGRGNQLRSSAQQALFPGLSAGLTAAVPGLFPLAQRAVTGIGGALGTGGKIAGQTLASAGVTHDLGVAVDGNNSALSTLTAGVAPLVRTAARLAAALAPVEKTLANDAVYAARFVDTWSAANTGKITNFLVRGLKMATQFGKGLWNLGGAVLNVVHAATGATVGGKTISQEFEDWSKHLDDITGSASGQRSLSAYFQRALPVAQQVLSLGKEILKDVAELGANTNLGNLIGDLHSALPGINDAAKGVTTMVTALADIDPNILKAIGTVGAIAYIGNKLNVGGLLGAITGGKGGAGGLLSGSWSLKNPLPVIVVGNGVDPLPAPQGNSKKPSKISKNGKLAVAAAVASKFPAAAAEVLAAHGVQSLLDSTKLAKDHRTLAGLGNTAADAGQGALAGRVLGPWGALAGTVAGGLFGLANAFGPHGSTAVPELNKQLADKGFVAWQLSQPTSARARTASQVGSAYANYQSERAASSTHRTDYSDIDASWSQAHSALNSVLQGAVTPAAAAAPKGPQPISIENAIFNGVQDVADLARQLKKYSDKHASRAP